MCYVRMPSKLPSGGRVLFHHCRVSWQLLLGNVCDSDMPSRDPSNCASPVLYTGDSVALLRRHLCHLPMLWRLCRGSRPDTLDHSDLGQLLPSDMCALCLPDESRRRSSKISPHRSFCVRLLPADVCCFSMPLWLSARPGCIRLNRRLNGNLLRCNLRNIQLSCRLRL